MTRFVPWLLVALCFVLGVASRSIADSFPVFVPALEQAFSANRGDVTIIYSFVLLVGGISGPVNGWILDRLGLRALTVLGMSLAAAATFLASHATALWHFYVTLGVMLGFGGDSVSGVLSASLLGRWFPARRLGVGLAACLPDVLDGERGVRADRAGAAMAAHRGRRAGPRSGACSERGGADGRRGDPRLAVLGAHLLVLLHLGRHLFA